MCGQCSKETSKRQVQMLFAGRNESKQQNCGNSAARGIHHVCQKMHPAMYQRPLCHSSSHHGGCEGNPVGESAFLSVRCRLSHLILMQAEKTILNSTSIKGGLMLVVGLAALAFSFTIPDSVLLTVAPHNLKLHTGNPGSLIHLSKM